MPPAKIARHIITEEPEEGMGGAAKSEPVISDNIHITSNTRDIQSEPISSDNIIS